MKFRAYIKHFLLFAVVILAISCRKDSLEQGNAPKRTVLMYIATNNSLYSETKPKVDAALAAWRPRYGKLLLFVDTPNQLPTLSEAVETGGVKQLVTIKEYRDGNSASAATFAEVLSDVRSASPDTHYGMVFFSHSTGWLPEHAFANPSMTSTETRSVGLSGRDEMELSDFAAAIPDRMFDYIIFESCFMAGVEVVYELRDKTNYIVSASSEIVMPGFTKTYPENIARLYGDNSKLVAIAKQFYQYSTTGDPYRSATVSVIRADHLEPLAKAVSNIKANNGAFNIADIQHFDRENDQLFFDLGDYMSAQATPAQMQAFDGAMANVVIYKAATKDFLLNWRGFEIESHSGLTTYIEQEKFPFLNQQYKLLDWSQAIDN